MHISYIQNLQLRTVLLDLLLLKDFDPFFFFFKEFFCNLWETLTVIYLLPFPLGKLYFSCFSLPPYWWQNSMILFLSSLYSVIGYFQRIFLWLFQTNKFAYKLSYKFFNVCGDAAIFKTYLNFKKFLWFIIFSNNI